MTDLTNGRARQSGDPMDSVSDVGEFPPNAKGRRTRRRRWYLFAVIPAMVLTIGVLLYSRGLCTMIGASSGIHIDLSSVLADASTPVHVHACVQSSCVSFTVEQMGSGGGKCASQTRARLAEHGPRTRSKSTRRPLRGTCGTRLVSRSYR